MFDPVDAKIDFPQQELRVLQWWKERRIYERSIEARADCPPFVFFEGPPTANGMPHPGHCLTRAIKDLFPRYRTMRGYYCPRKAGWDTHGLPVEVEVCKALGIHSKEEIEALGVERFIQECQQSVWRYMQQWERLTERIGFWIKLEEAYVTYHQSYVESVWWSLKRLFDQGLLYQGHKIVWWWAQGGTALSAGEVGQGYREVADPSVFVRFPLLDENGQPTDQSLLVWTTTPWTLPSNQFAAVHPDVVYAVVDDDQLGQQIILARDLVEAIAKKVGRELRVRATLPGRELVGRRYVPPFDFYYKDQGQRVGKLVGGAMQPVAWRIVAADFVTTDSGTGAVHEAPAFGEVDFGLWQAEQARFVPGDGPPLLNAIAPNGCFTDEAPDFAGMWVKDADRPITRSLRDRGLLYHQEQYVHEYPFCWRADEDPLIQYPRRSWFIATRQFRDAMLANNARINWLPEHIRDGRFGNFLESNVDWALSRERYWGTPLPIWVCSETGRMEAVASLDELLGKPGASGMEVWEAAKRARPDLPDDLRIHKPYIDAIEYDSPFAPGARMRRVSEVIDCWYDSGAMPFAQWGYPHSGREMFRGQFPADFISEALDQTRGWFYSLLAISTMLFGERAAADEPNSPATQVAYPHPFKNCIVLGLMLGEDGEKMSKQKRNYREPQEIFDRYGADALRWYFFSNQPPWTSIRYREQAIKESVPEFLLRLWNCYSFFVIYANIDGFDPAARLEGDVGALEPHALARARGYRPIDERSELDRWILSELRRTTRAVTERMDAYDNYEACRYLNEFVDGLSNWYVRRGRQRYWASQTDSPDKLDAYWTLYECLVTTARLVAPFVPFLAETLWRNLAGVFDERATESVHLCDYPSAEGEAIDALLSARMNLLRQIASLGRSARMDHKLKIRQPLAKVEVILADPSHQAWLEEHDELLRDELNVKLVDYAPRADEYITYHIQPNFKRLGPRIGKLLPALKAVLAGSDGGKLLDELNRHAKVEFVIDGQRIELDSQDIQVRLEAKPGWAAAQGSGCVVVLATELTDELIAEGQIRDVVRVIQDLRKDKQLEFTARIEVAVVGVSPELRNAVERFQEYVAGETLAVDLTFKPLDGIAPSAVEVAGQTVQIYLRVAEQPHA